MSEEFKVIETQEAFDAAIQSRLDRQKKAVTAEVTKQYEGWVSPEEAKKSADQIESLTKQVSELTAKNTAYQLGALRTKIAHETGLPYELADRLQGDDEAAIRADAESLAKLTSPRPANSPDYSPETPPGASADAAFRALANELNS